MESVPGISATLEEENVLRVKMPPWWVGRYQESEAVKLEVLPGTTVDTKAFVTVDTGLRVHIIGMVERVSFARLKKVALEVPVNTVSPRTPQFGFVL